MAFNSASKSKDRLLYTKHTDFVYPTYLVSPMRCKSFIPITVPLSLGLDIHYNPSVLALAKLHKADMNVLEISCRIWRTLLHCIAWLRPSKAACHHHTHDYKVRVQTVSGHTYFFWMWHLDIARFLMGAPVPSPFFTYEITCWTKTLRYILGRPS